MIIDLVELLGALLEILVIALICYIVARILVFIIGLIIKPIYKKRQLPDSRVELTKRKVFKYLYMSLISLGVIFIVYRYFLSMQLLPK